MLLTFWLSKFVATPLSVLYLTSSEHLLFENITHVGSCTVFVFVCKNICWKDKPPYSTARLQLLNSAANIWWWNWKQNIWEIFARRGAARIKKSISTFWAGQNCKINGFCQPTSPSHLFWIHPQILDKKYIGTKLWYFAPVRNGFIFRIWAQHRPSYQ